MDLKNQNDAMKRHRKKASLSYVYVESVVVNSAVLLGGMSIKKDTTVKKKAKRQKKTLDWKDFGERPRHRRVCGMLTGQ